MSQWESKSHTQLKRHMLDFYKVKFGEARAATLTNIWFNYHYGGCTYNKELMDIIKTWPDPKTVKNEVPLHPSNQTGKEIGGNSQDQQNIIIMEEANSNVHNEDKKYGFQATSVAPLKVKPYSNFSRSSVSEPAAIVAPPFADICDNVDDGITITKVIQPKQNVKVKPYSNFCRPSTSEPATVEPPFTDICDNLDDGITITEVIQSKPNMYAATFCKSSTKDPARVATPPPAIVTVTDDKAFVDPYKIDDELEFIREDLDISPLEEFCYNLINHSPKHTSKPITLLKVSAKRSRVVLNYHHTMTGSMVIDTRNQTKRKIRKTKNEDYQKVADDNIGNLLLKGMGWVEGTGLGKNEQGMVDPIINMGQVSRHGLGTENYFPEERKLCPGHMSSLEINGIFVAHGIACNQHLAKHKCAKHALDYLTKRYQNGPTQSGTFTKLNHDLDITTLNFQLHLLENYNATSILQISAEKCGAEIAFIDLEPDKKQGKQHSATVKINNIFIASGIGCTPKEARLAAAKQAINHLKNLGVEQYNEKGAVPGALVMSKTSGLWEHNWLTQADEDWDAETSQTGYNKSNNGWNGWDDKVSKDEAEISITWDSGTMMNKNQTWKHLEAVPAGHESVNSNTWISREQYYSNREPTVSESEMEQKLIDFMDNPNVEELAFPLDMSNADRKLVHVLAQGYGLKHKSRGKPGVNRQLFVSKK